MWNSLVTVAWNTDFHVIFMLFAAVDVVSVSADLLSDLILRKFMCKDFKCHFVLHLE